MTELYEENFKVVSKYVHATSRGHEAIQIAIGMQLTPYDFVAPYYRDDSILLSIGMRPYELMLQLMAKKDDPFSAGRAYYCHPSLRDDDKPKIPHQSSATGMQAIPSAGVAMGIQYREKRKIQNWPKGENPVSVCSLGDASVTEGEVAEAFQMAALKQFPVLFLVQDNGWDISANAAETRAMNAAEYAKGFPGIEVRSIDGSDFVTSYETVHQVLQIMRKERRPFLIHAKVPLLNHHTSGVRKEWYRDDLAEHQKRDPYPKLIKSLLEYGVKETEIKKIETKAIEIVAQDFEEARHSAEPKPEDLYTHEFVETPIKEETGERFPEGHEPIHMVDCGVFAIKELMRNHPECLLYGQDVGPRLGGVFREAATLAKTFGKDRVFNTPIQEAFIIGSTVGMSAVGLKPIVEVQFADYLYPGINQLFTEVSRSCYLSNGKWPVSMILRVPIGAYGSGGPYHSSSVESVVTSIKGLKIAFPSNGADLKGLFKAAYYDGNPVIIFEHKGLYWSKVQNTERARSIEPAEDYILPFGKANVALPCDDSNEKPRLTIITYGMCVHWSVSAAEAFPGQVEVIDLRTLQPLDTATMYASVRKTNRCLVVTEEQVSNSFAQTLAARVQENCFEYLDAPVRTIGSKDVPAIPLNEILELEMVLRTHGVEDGIRDMLAY
jgi:2-oxoisovalerate dehydrogenase E1 component